MTNTPTPIAIIGMSCRTAGADDLTDLWDLVVAGERHLVTPDPSRWVGVDLPAGMPRAGLIENVDEFDARFFGIAPRMAAWMDPQHRMLLELTWHALENAGMSPTVLSGEPVAVLAGAFLSEYRDSMVTVGQTNSAAFPGTLMSFLANRISYQFGWTGPSMVIDSACSSGMSALGVAISGLRASEYPMALVAAANLSGAGFYTNTAALSGALSATGNSVPFSAERDGYVRGEGAVCLVLKPLDAARADGDPVHAVITSIVTTHKGQSGGLTATNGSVIASLLRAASTAAGHRVSDIGFVEAHGTGTPNGDAAEVGALAEVLAESPTAAGPRERLWVGAIKSNIGHLEAASGLIGVVKAVHAVKHGLIPGIAGLDEVDPGLPIKSAPLGITSENIAWPSTAIRRAAVNSFGLGGSLSHAIVEEFRTLTAATALSAPSPRVIPLAAGSESAVARFCEQLARELTRANDVDVADVAWTLQLRDHPGRVRMAIVARGMDSLLSSLESPISSETDGFRHLGLPECHQAIVDAWLNGESPDWSILWHQDEHPRRLHLPGTPFERRSHWFHDRTGQLL